MALTITAQAPKFHSLTGTQPVGQSQVAVTSDYAGTITVLNRTAETYWVVVTRSAVGAFTDRPKHGWPVAVWFDAHDGGVGRFVVDYTDEFGDRVEADRTRSLGAAIGAATDTASQLWARMEAQR